MWFGLEEVGTEIQLYNFQLIISTDLKSSMDDEFACCGPWNPDDDGGVQSCSSGPDDAERKIFSVGEEPKTKRAVQLPESCRLGDGTADI